MQDSQSFNENIQTDSTATISGVWVAAINGLVSGDISQSGIEIYIWV
jgi:hypothetical protein